jgi:hypothetical protein
MAADSRWLAALGSYIAHRGSIPGFVPYASAPSHGWHDVPVLGELVFHGLVAMGGDRGLLVAQVAAATVAVALLALDAVRAEAAAGATPALLLAIVATFAELVEIRAQLFSIALFPALVVLLRSEARRPSRRVWLLPPLVAFWSNLHGAVLVGLAVAGAYLVFERTRREPVVAGGALVGCVLGLFATPSLWRSGDYYWGVLQNEAARRGVGLWQPLSFHSGVDIVFLVCAVVLAAAVLRSRPPLWELVVLLGLAVLTARVARGGIWFAFFAVTPAARTFGRGPAPRTRIALVAVPAFLALAVVGLIRGPHETAADGKLLDRALAAAAGTPILATDQLAEQVALAGGRIWLGNPIDAFRRRDQRKYLDWVAGKPAGDAALRHAPKVVLARPGSAAQRRLAARGVFREAGRDAHAVLYVRP